MEWNEETAEEQVGVESPALVTDDTGEQSSEKKDDDAVNYIEENEWDRLLRMRLDSSLAPSSAVFCSSQNDIDSVCSCFHYLLIVS